MFVLARAVTYATLFIAFVLVFLPSRLLSSSGVRPPSHTGVLQVVGLLVSGAGLTLALSCVLAFALIGKGTPAPFDPPRTLVVRGPYRWVRNPMYVGAATALAGAATYYQSLPLLGYVLVFLLISHTFVLTYEEPVLRRTFGPEYDSYCRRVGRWLPRRPTADR